MFKQIRAVLFDLDGTLIDSAPDLGAAADKMRTDRGLPSFPLDHYRHMAGAGARGMLGIAFSTTPEQPEFAALREEFFVNYEKCMRERTYAFKGVAELIGEIDRQGLSWGVVTNKSSRFTDPLTRQMPLFKTAGAVVSGDTTPHTKPHPAPLLEAARRLNLDPGRCVYVGDDERDIAAGLAAGMFTVAATYGYLGSNADTLKWARTRRSNAPRSCCPSCNPAYRRKIRGPGAALVSTWVRTRGRACRAECARKNDSNKLTANDERFALAA